MVVFWMLRGRGRRLVRWAKIRDSFDIFKTRFVNKLPMLEGIFLHQKMRFFLQIPNM